MLSWQHARQHGTELAPAAAKSFAETQRRTAGKIASAAHQKRDRRRTLGCEDRRWAETQSKTLGGKSVQRAPRRTKLWAALFGRKRKPGAGSLSSEESSGNRDGKTEPRGKQMRCRQLRTATGSKTEERAEPAVAAFRTRKDREGTAERPRAKQWKTEPTARTEIRRQNRASATRCGKWKSLRRGFHEKGSEANTKSTTQNGSTPRGFRERELKRLWAAAEIKEKQVLDQKQDEFKNRTHEDTSSRDRNQKKNRDSDLVKEQSKTSWGTTTKIRKFAL
jgi:hypothetical protein